MPHNPLNTTAMAALMRTLERTDAPAELVAHLWAIRGMRVAQQAEAIRALREQLAAIRVG
jgi:hypothetical protein